MESPMKEKKNPVRSQNKTKKQKKKSRGVGEGWPGIGVVETVDVSVKNDLMRAHVVVLKDGGESVVLVVEALVTPVGVDRSNRSRESATGAAGAG
jgi:hypothetical protein